MSIFLIFEKNRCPRNTIKDLNLALNHDISYHFNIKMTENIKIFGTTIDEVGTLCIPKLRKKNSHKLYKNKDPDDFVSKNV